MARPATRILAALALMAPALALGPAASGQDNSWTSRRLPWYDLPRRDLIGVAPASLPMPAAPGACGAISDRLEPFAAHGAVFVRAAVRVESGAVIIALRSQDAASLLSREKTIRPGDGVVSVFFRVDPGDSQRAIVLCQASASGEDSRADIESLTVAFVDALPADEAAKANVGTLGQ